MIIAILEKLQRERERGRKSKREKEREGGRYSPYLKFADILYIYYTRQDIYDYTYIYIWQIVQRSNADRGSLLITALASCLPQAIFNDVVNDCY